jgi:hypothetical protein
VRPGANISSAIIRLFRSAASTHRAHVTGVLLTGNLDDGTAGLRAVKKCGGITIVQDPKDARYPEMPQSALNNVEVNHCVPVSEMGSLLEKLTIEHPGKSKSIPKAIGTEALIANGRNGPGMMSSVVSHCDPVRDGAAADSGEARTWRTSARPRLRLRPSPRRVSFK